LFVFSALNKLLWGQHKIACGVIILIYIVTSKKNNGHVGSTAPN